MPDDNPTPTPWVYDGITIKDANDGLVAIMAQRLYAHPVVVAKITMALEMYDTLVRVDRMLNVLPETALTTDVKSLIKTGRPTTVVEPPDKSREEG